MQHKKLDDSELILNADDSIYHLNLKPGDLAQTILLVGDPNRVPLVSQHFDSIELKKHKREFVTHTGFIGSKRISVIGTGMGGGNIDILMNEADALFNVDFKSRTVKPEITSLEFIRMGTTGSLVEDIPVDSLVISHYALAFDGLISFYKRTMAEDETQLLQQTQAHFAELPIVGGTYVARGSQSLCEKLTPIGHSGITLTCTGFYGSQYRQIRIELIDNNIFEPIETFEFNRLRITNLEMETAAIYGLGRLLHHECCSVSAVVANRKKRQFSNDSERTVKRMISKVLDVIV